MTKGRKSVKNKIIVITIRSSVVSRKTIYNEQLIYGLEEKLQRDSTTTTADDTGAVQLLS